MIGRLEKLPLRNIWKHEAKDFTTWMQDNIDVLNQVLDFQLSNVEREKTTGNFNVDLVAEDEDGNPVIIENQLEKSNHDHLGKVITYLASIGAGKAIWIVAEPRQEHIKAFSWLNESTAASFYLVKIEAIRIGDSLPAPFFTLIVGPSEETLEAGATKKEYAERHHIRKRFWALLLEKAKERTRLHANISPGVGSWVAAGAGLSGVIYSYSIGRYDAKVELYIDKDRQDGTENKKLFDTIYANKSKVEEIFGSELSWERMDGKRASRIAKHFDKGFKNEEAWDVLADSMIDAMINLEKALSPYLKK